MRRIIITYGTISGLVVIGSMILSFVVDLDKQDLPVDMQFIGYLTMLIALSVIFIGIKQYRDKDLGGVITFGTGLLIGLGISVVAGIMYVTVWEIYLATTDYAFIEDYIASVIAGKEAEGMSGAELDAIVADMDTLRTQYANPAFRLPMTFLEIFPVGLVITLISAAVLRRSEVLPAD